MMDVCMYGFFFWKKKELYLPNEEDLHRHKSSKNVKSGVCDVQTSSVATKNNEESYCFEKK